MTHYFIKAIRSTMKQAMEASLKRILTPKTSVDLLRDIEQARAESRPYTICFVGVNGVGKVNLFLRNLSCSLGLFYYYYHHCH